MIRQGADRDLLQGLKMTRQLSERLKEVWTEFDALRKAIKPVLDLFAAPEDNQVAYSEVVKRIPGCVFWYLRVQTKI